MALSAKRPSTAPVEEQSCGPAALAFSVGVPYTFSALHPDVSPVPPVPCPIFSND